MLMRDAGLAPLGNPSTARWQGKQIREILTTEYGSVFGPEDIANITAAFDAVLNKVGRLNREGPMTVIVANTIIQLAKDGGARTRETVQCRLEYSSLLEPREPRAGIARPPNSNWSSISRLPRNWALTRQSRCLRARTR
jgi:hypothetical protein